MELHAAPVTKPGCGSKAKLAMLCSSSADGRPALTFTVLDRLLTCGPPMPGERTRPELPNLGDHWRVAARG